MNSIIPFIKLDYMTIKPYFMKKNFTIYVAVFIFVGYTTRDPFMLTCAFMLSSTIYSSYTFAERDKYNLDILYASLPLGKGLTVIGRYAFTLLFNILAGAAAFVFAAILMLIMGIGLNIASILMDVLIFFALFTFVEAIQLPFYFKQDYEKVRALIYLPILAFPAIIVGGIFFAEEEETLSFTAIHLWLQGRSISVLLLLFLAWLSMMLVSLYFSYKFYRNKEI